MTHAIEVQTQTIELGLDQNILFMPFIDDVDPQPTLLVIETPDLDEREIQMLGLAEPARTLSLYRQVGNRWMLHLRTELDASMGIVDTVRSRSGIAFAGYRRAQVHLLQQHTSNFKPISERQIHVCGQHLGRVIFRRDVPGPER